MNNTRAYGYEDHLQENIMWERTLDFYLQQNAFLKTKLSHAIDHMMSKHFLAEAENFQNLFLQNDENIKELQSDIDLLQRSLKDGSFDHAYLDRTYRKLGNEINNFEKKFAALKNDFGKYMETIR